MTLSAVPLDTPLRLRTLGGAGLYDARNETLVLGAGKPFALLVFLALAPGRRASRESLIDLLWSDVDPERARNALRQSLFQLRRLLGDDAVAGVEELALRLELDVDRDRFLGALEANDLEGALLQYVGTFLPSFGVPGGAAFEQWADLERDRLQAGFVRGAELLVRRLLNSGNTSDAKVVARRTRDLLPNAESSGRLLLEAAIAARDFVSAAMEASTLEQWANGDGIVLEPATRALIARARRVSSAPRETGEPNFQLVPELTGREQEFFTITSAWDALRIGASRHIHLSAPAGLGKSRLLRDAVARLEGAGALVVQLRGRSGDRLLPYAFASDLAAELSQLPGAAGVAPASIAALLALNPALSTRLHGAADTALGEEALRRRILALADMMQSVADEQRLVLCIDDLHWIDAPSMQVLEGLWSRLPRARVLCITAARPERVPSADQCEVLPLVPLSTAQVGALVSGLGVVPTHEAWTAAFVHGLHDATRGNPLLILQTLRLAMDQSMLAIEHNEWRCLDEARLTGLLRAGEALRERIRALPKDEQTVLAVVATLGAPCTPAELGAVAPMVIGDVASKLEPLERLGLITLTGSGLTVHDEIAVVVRDALSVTQLMDIERAVGNYFARDAHADRTRLLRAVRHLGAAGDEEAVARLYRQFAELARSRGDRRSFRELAAELTGEDAASTRVRALQRSLPVSWQIGLRSPVMRIAAVAAIVLAPTMAFSLWRTSRIDTASHQRVYLTDSTLVAMRADVATETWGGNAQPVNLVSTSSPQAAEAMADPNRPPALSPDGRSAAWTKDSGDSTTLDIWIRTPAGERRLTRQLRDDLVFEWLPDGSALVGATDRWTKPGSLGYDIAVFDTSTGAARPISSGPDHDGQPSVSPDGTRVAFLRESNEFPERVCVTTIDGQSVPDCRLIDGRPVGDVLGWSGLDEVLLIVDHGDSRPLLAYDWERRSTREILGPHASHAVLSPDRKWVIAALRIDGVRGVRDWIAPLGRPSDARPIGNSDRRVARWWEGPADTSRVIRRIEFADTTRIIPLGLSTRLRVHALADADLEVPLRVPVRWSSSDTTIAVVDTTGEVRPRRAGVVTITASLVGWRVAKKTLRVDGEPSSVVFTENWDTSWPSRWILFGDPRPTVVTGPENIRGFWNRGDGVFVSMGVIKPAFSARYGLGVELRVSTPLLQTKWQRIRAGLVSGIDTAAIIAADQRKASPNALNSDVTCGFGFPGSGMWGRTHLTTTGGVARDHDLGATAIPLQSGAWWTIRLQILPDGRCGVAINGKVLWISPEPIALDATFRLRLGDESAGTRLLHGPLQMWTGVRTDIDWSSSRR